MRKTLLAALIGASVFAVLPALAQVSLDGAGKVGAGVTTGATPGQVGNRAGDTLQRADRHARHATRQATERTRSTLDHHRRADADVGTNGSADVGAGNTHAHANVDANGTTRGIGDQASDSAHAAIDSTDRAAGSVGDAVRHTANGTSVGADAKVRAKANAHGH